MPGRVAEFLVDGEGFAVPVVGLIQPPAVLGGGAELVVGDGHAGAVAESLVDGEGFAVPVVGLIQPPPLLGGGAELVEVLAMPGRSPNSSLMVRDLRYQSSASSSRPRSWAVMPS